MTSARPPQLGLAFHVYGDNRVNAVALLPLHSQGWTSLVARKEISDVKIRFGWTLGTHKWRAEQRMSGSSSVPVSLWFYSWILVQGQRLVTNYDMSHHMLYRCNKAQERRLI